MGWNGTPRGRYYEELVDWLTDASGREIELVELETWRPWEPMYGFTDILPGLNANQVTEPSTVALFALGLAGIGAVKRKKLAA